MLIFNKFHSSRKTLSDIVRTTELNNTVNSVTANDLQLIKLDNNIQNTYKDPEKIENITSYKEAFPWLVAEGTDSDYYINLENKITLFEAVQHVSRYLETRLQVNPENISSEKLTKFLEPFVKNKEITVKELFNHIKTIYDNDPAFLNSDIVKEKEIKSTEIINKPLGSVGDITVNEIINKLNDVKIIDFVLNHHKFVINGLPLGVMGISYGTVMWAYMSKVHNRPIPSHINTDVLRATHIKRKEIQLAIFAFIGAPLIVAGLRQSAISIKDIITIEFVDDNNNNTTVPDNTSQNSNKGYLFLLLKSITNYIPL